MNDMTSQTSLARSKNAQTPALPRISSPLRSSPLLSCLARSALPSPSSHFPPTQPNPPRQPKQHPVPGSQCTSVHLREQTADRTQTESIGRTSTHERGEKVDKPKPKPTTTHHLKSIKSIKSTTTPRLSIKLIIRIISSVPINPPASHPFSRETDVARDRSIMSEVGPADRARLLRSKRIELR